MPNTPGFFSRKHSFTCSESQWTRDSAAACKGPKRELQLNFAYLGPVPFYPFFGEGSPSKIDYRKEGTLILTSLLEYLVIDF